MASMYLILVAACVTAVVARDFGVPKRCKTVLNGDESGTPVVLPPSTLSPGVRDWTVTIPNGCPYTDTVGTKFTACDYDRAPVVNFMDETNVFVHRTGSTALSGVVKVTVYCDSEVNSHSGRIIVVPH